MPRCCHVPPRSFLEDELISFMWLTILLTELLNGARPAKQHNQHLTLSAITGCHS